MGTPATRVAYAYLRQEEAATQQKNITFNTSKNIFRKFLNLITKFSKRNAI